MTYGYTAGILVESQVTGYCTTARGLCNPVVDWHVGAIPLVNMTSIKAYSTYYKFNKPVVASFDVQLHKGAFLELKNHQDKYKLTDYYLNPGII